MELKASCRDANSVLETIKPNKESSACVNGVTGKLRKNQKLRGIGPTPKPYASLFSALSYYPNSHTREKLNESVIPLNMPNGKKCPFFLINLYFLAYLFLFAITLT